jgi:small subunit ribosomal protein S4
MLVEKGDVLVYREKSKNHDELSAIVEANESKSVPGWLDINRDEKEVRIVSFPSRYDVALEIEEHLIVELYSK